MGFLGVYKAVYDYVPQSEGELAITEGDLLFVLEKSGEDDWWRAKKKASGDDDDEPVGLIPNNYIEEVCACLACHLLYGDTSAWIVLNVYVLLHQEADALLDLPCKFMGLR
jgi:actin cytoskeleton-regulatory complex protein SLA1